MHAPLAGRVEIDMDDALVDVPVRERGQQPSAGPLEQRLEVDGTRQLVLAGLVAVAADDAYEADATVLVGDAQAWLAPRRRFLGDGVGDRELGEQTEVVETRELFEPELAAVAVWARGQAADVLHHLPRAPGEAGGTGVRAQRRQVEGDGRAIDTAGARAPHALGLELLERARVVMVELDEVPAGSAHGPAGHRLAIGPARVVGDGGGVDAHRRDGGWLQDGLDARRLGRVTAKDVGDLGVGLHGQGIGWRAVSTEAEVDPGDAHVGGITETSQDRGDIVVDERDHEFIHIEEGQPRERRTVEAQGVGVGVDLPPGQGPVDQCHQTVVDPRLDDLVQSVGAAVVVDEEVADAERVMVRQPLGQVRRLVADDDHDAEPEARRRQQRALAGDVRRGGAVALA